MADKRFQVFVSSTYDDLLDERREVMQALLELECIPAGMELFPASDDSQWALICRVIENCDYYIVILGGRYGSTNADGVSFTEMEYRYALKLGKPIIAFLHSDPDSLSIKRTEKSHASRKKLEGFRKLCQQKLVRYWTTAAELGGKVSRDLVRLTKDQPGIGWVRADTVPTWDVLQQLLTKNIRLEEMEQLVANATNLGLVAMHDCTGNFGPKAAWLDLIKGAHESMDLMGRTLYEWIRAPELEEILIKKVEQDGVFFRWLLMSQKNQHLRQLEEDGELIGQAISRKIEPVCKHLHTIRLLLPSEKRRLLQVRAFDRVPLYCSIVRADDRYLITPYLQSAASRNCPLFTIRGQSTPWAVAYQREFEMVWTSAKEPERPQPDS